MNARSISLLYVPDPILDESPASWLIRVCEFHDVYPNKLFEVFGLPKMVDYDRALGVDELDVLTQGTKVDKEKIICLSKKFQHIKADSLAEVFLLSCFQDRGIYRYCAQCLAEDLTPYWRLTWRMTHVYYCAHHRCELLNHCLKCGKALTAIEKWKRTVEDYDPCCACRFCTACGADLSRFSSRAVPLSIGFRRALGLQRTITAALIHGHFFVQGIKDALPLRYLPRALLLGGHKDCLGKRHELTAMFPSIRDFLTGALPIANDHWGRDDAWETMIRAMRMRFHRQHEEYSSDQHSSDQNYVLRF